ncbi:hypothetical protein [Brevibacillus reuszeri]|uniref:hypothetical protein n=1 Tax=Brevibacillus reuszeri TaxID=54915 RepID=UPI002896CE7D|nr:hypothetical protein [Brevibacillus reuszeri]
MQETSTVLDDYVLFLSTVDEVCVKLGLSRDDFSTPEELFHAVFEKFSLKTLQQLDEMMGDDHLRDDLLGVMHRAVRERAQVQHKGGLSA